MASSLQLGALAGLLGGFGGFGQQVGQAGEFSRTEALKQQQLAIDQQRADQLMELQRNRLAQEQRQFEATQAEKYVPADQLSTLMQMLGIKGAAGTEVPAAGLKIPATALPALLTRAAEQEKVAREQAIFGRQANVLERLGQGAPAVPATAAVPAPFEDQLPGEGVAAMPGQPATPRREDLMVASQMLRAGGALPPLLEKILDRGNEQQRTLDLLKQVQGMSNQGGGAPRINFVPSISKEGLTFRGDAEPPNYQATRQALAEAGWQEGMPGYWNEFKTQIEQPVAIAEGGKATSRTEGIRPPSYYAGGGVGTGTAMPGGAGLGQERGGPPAPGSQARWTGEPKTVPAAVAKDITTGLQMREAVNQITEALKDPVTANYIGPVAQYRDWVQGKAPGEALGKIPPAVVQLDQNLHALQNYTIRLITGAQMSAPEANRIMSQLPQRGNQADEFRQRIKMTLDDVSQMEQSIRTLALQGDTNAKLVAAQLGLNQFRENILPPGQAPPPGSIPMSQGGYRNPAATLPPKLSEGTRVRDPRTGRTGTVPPNTPIPPGLELLR